MGNSQPKKPSNTNEFKLVLEKRLTPLFPSPNTSLLKTKSKGPTKPAPQHVRKITLSARPIQGTRPIQGNNEVVTNVIDGRKPIEATAKDPYSVHGLIACKFQSETYWGTGILIGPNVVLTAGHNLYNHQLKSYVVPGSLRFLPGMNGKALPFGSVEVEQYFVSPNYLKEEKEDYGILILKKPIGEETGYFGLACLEPEKLKKKKINVTGYPSDKVGSKSNTYEMWGMEGQAAHIDQAKGHINYLIDTAAGQSGSGVWYQEGENYYVCGVHVSGTQFVNTATLLTREIYKQIHKWLQAASFNEFLFELGETKQLKLSRQEINTEHVSLVMRYNLDDLVVLRLSWNEIGFEAMEALAENASWKKLSRLYLEESNIDAEGAKALAKNTSWVDLSRLHLTCNNICAEGARALAKNIFWVNLSLLDLSWNNLGTEGVKALAQNTSWVNLIQLDLEGNQIDPEGAKCLAKNTSWINLSLLYLSWNKLGTKGAKHLAQNTSWINLSQLELSHNKINPDGLTALKQNSTWEGIRILGASKQSSS